MCKKCDTEKPATTDYFYKHRGQFTSAHSLEGTCRGCRDARTKELRAAALETTRNVKAVGGSAKLRLAEDGSEGSYTEHPDDGYRFVAIPDTHGRLIDWKAAEAALAFVRFYKPVVVFLLGDHVDFDAFSRFDGPSERMGQVAEDCAEWDKFAGKLNESAPNARKKYHKGNHEHRFQKWLWKHPEIAALLKWQGMDLPNILRLGEHGIEWVESGTTQVNERLMVKHGHMVRSRSGYTATGELDRNGITGISGHTHRLGQVYKRDRVGIKTWVESGCLCRLDPSYAEGQTVDWIQGLSFGTIALRGNAFSVHTAPIVNGKVMVMGAGISA